MQIQHRKEADHLYLFLAALFIAALVTCNLIANKFITIDLGFKQFIISAGVLPYPITFLITDILSEIYGKKRATRVIMAGFAASLFVLFILWLGSLFPAIEQSPINNLEYDKMFGNSWRIIMASMLAYLIAQLVDVRVFHFWKTLTKGRHLWLRNNGSTFISQFADTTLVVMVLFAGTMPFSQMLTLILDGWIFKILCALLDTPVFYLATYLSRKRFNIRAGEELALE